MHKYSKIDIILNYTSCFTKKIFILTFAFLFLACFSVPAKYLKIAIISDLNESYGSVKYSNEALTAINLINNENPDIVLCAGDMIAAQKSSLSDSQIINMWNAFENCFLKPLLYKKIPFAFTLGNHDASGYNNYFKDRDIAKKFWIAKINQLNLNYIDNSNFPFYYSFFLNQTFIVVLYANTSEISSNQINWLKKQLLQNAEKFKTKLVIGHLPLFPITNERKGSNDYIYNNQTLINILADYDVDFYISGHQHAFYLTTINNTHLLFAGALGAGQRSYINSSQKSKKIISFLIIDSNSRKHKIRNYELCNKNYQIYNLKELPEKIWINNILNLKRTNLCEY